MWGYKVHTLFTLRNILRNEQQAVDITSGVFLLFRVWTSAHFLNCWAFLTSKNSDFGEEWTYVVRGFQGGSEFPFQPLLRGQGNEHGVAVMLRLRGSRRPAVTPGLPKGPISVQRGLCYLSVELSEIHSISKTFPRALTLWKTPVIMQNLRRAEEGN